MPQPPSVTGPARSTQVFGEAPCRKVDVAALQQRLAQNGVFVGTKDAGR